MEISELGSWGYATKVADDQLMDEIHSQGAERCVGSRPRLDVPKIRKELGVRLCRVLEDSLIAHAERGYTPNRAIQLTRRIPRRAEEKLQRLRLIRHTNRHAYGYPLLTDSGRELAEALVGWELAELYRDRSDRAQQTLAAAKRLGMTELIEAIKNSKNNSSYRDGVWVSFEDLQRLLAEAER